MARTLKFSKARSAAPIIKKAEKPTTVEDVFAMMAAQAGHTVRKKPVADPADKKAKRMARLAKQLEMFTRA